MCRLLSVRSESEFRMEDYLYNFSIISKNSKEYQGHGWGCSYLDNGSWKHYKNIDPIWEEDFSRFGKTKLLIAHARSAFRDEGISIENNMPFCDDRYIFVFNGELRGVKIKSEGRIGAEKIFNYIKRFNNGNMKSAIEKGTYIINKQTSYIKAMNFIICDKQDTYVYSLFNEDPEYFTMYYKYEPELVVSSVPLSEGTGWKQIANNTLTKF